MKCPQCGHSKSFVKDSRPAEEYIYRRRECFVCNHRFSTSEFIDGKIPAKFKAIDHLTLVRKSLIKLEEVIREYQKYKEREMDQTQPIKVMKNG